MRFTRKFIVNMPWTTGNSSSSNINSINDGRSSIGSKGSSETTTIIIRDNPTTTADAPSTRGFN